MSVLDVVLCVVVGLMVLPFIIAGWLAVFVVFRDFKDGTL